MQTSIFTNILKAVQAEIVALALTDSPTVLRRKIPVIGVDDPLPLILVTPEKETVFAQDTRGLILIDYPVLVTFAFSGNQLLETDIDRILDYREAIRWALNSAKLTGVANVIDTTIDLNPVFELPRYPAELDVSAFRMTYRSSESWNR